MDIHGHMDTHRHAWTLTDTYGHPWTYTDIHGHVWAHMDTHMSHLVTYTYMHVAHVAMQGTSGHTHEHACAHTMSHVCTHMYIHVHT